MYALGCGGLLLEGVADTVTVKVEVGHDAVAA